ncbi:MAG: hypothetical protein A2Z02_04335 [Chloroflexi bacterium RBG_16_48_7]|nr:MAG: hypothetical protein A2Z02_04335 [Chloroflexi bacterium RBG_16_48_7]
MAEKRASVLQADLVVVGGGGAGLVAAATALENKVKNIIVLEKRAVLGGNSIFPHGILATETSLLKRSGYDTKRDDIFQAMMQYTQWKADPRLIRALVDQTPNNIVWMEKNGIHFTKIGSLYANQIPITAHCVEEPEGVGAVVIKKLVRKLQDHSIRIMTKTSAKRILTDKKVKVSGLLATGNNGDFKINTSCIIMATGGFAGNPKLIRKFDPSYNEKELVHGGIPNTGDATTMCAEIGAAVEGMVMEMDGQEFPWAKGISVAARRASNIWVNRNGDRFVSESVRSVNEVANAIYRQPGRISYSLFDERIKKRICNDEPAPIEMVFLGGKSINSLIEKELKEQVPKGRVKISNSWDEIAMWMGASATTLKSTVKQYNTYCNNKHDEIFVKDAAFMMPLRTPPYYAVKCCIRLLTTHGGPRVNERMEVLDIKENPITGLYAAGTEIGGAEWGTYYIFAAGHSFGFTVSSGRIAGDEASRYIRHIK